MRAAIIPVAGAPNPRVGISLTHVPADGAPVRSASLWLQTLHVCNTHLCASAVRLTSATQTGYRVNGERRVRQVICPFYNYVRWSGCANPDPEAMRVNLEHALVAGLLALVAGLAGCDANSASGATARVRLGYFPNITHAPAIVALQLGFVAEALGDDAKLESRTFNAGPEEVEAIFSDALDLAYIGPNPAINAFVQSGGEAIRIVAGAASGGAALVVQAPITSPAQLRGTKLATPQRGNTQDIALRSWLKAQGLTASLEGGGDVSIVPQPNAQTLETFRAGQIQGAWVPEPWATRLVLEGGGSVLVDERTLWPGGKFVTTVVVARTAFLRQRPDLVTRVLRAHVRAVDFLNAEPARARGIVNAAIERLSGRALPAPTLERAWANLTFTVDPIAGALRRSARDAAAVGLLDEVSLDGIHDLTPLNLILSGAGRPRIPE
jgi:sulfonate transport system substrate-binding protein